MISNPCFQFKASFSSCLVLHLLRLDLADLNLQLEASANATPNFFQNSPVIIDLDKIKSLGKLDFAKLKEILMTFKLIPIGIRNPSAEQQEAAAEVKLPVVAASKNMPQSKKMEKSSHTKIINYPMRSGMQVYAKEGDLIVMTQVSPGAEVMADGCIHIYGTLRGRALAGVQGNTEARIFCRQLEAELVAIAGYYLTKDDMQSVSSQTNMMQIYLEHEQIKIESL
ncbi:MAG: septum site-determining protein MinC [Rickettsia endosymbiont of Ixodes persulcatus]|nr:septum site-determining protein MinC [Rickettsia endosymbiont of Ixodes persulcatus]